MPESQRSSEQQSLVTRFASSGMRNLVATYVHHPSLAEHILPFEHYVSSESGLPPRHRALLVLRTAWLTRSGYLWAHKVGAARQAGVTGDELTRIAQGPDVSGWDAFDATLLRAADELHVDSFVSDATWQALSARYNTNQLVDVIDTVGTLTMHAGAINSLGVEIEANVTARLPTGVPYVVSAKRTNLRLLGREPRIPPLEPEDWTPEQRKRFDPKGTGQRAANVFVTFVRNPPADRVRGPINQHILNAHDIVGSSARDAAHAHRRPVPLRIRVGRPLPPRATGRHDRRRRRAHRRRTGQPRRRSARDGIDTRDRRTL